MRLTKLQQWQITEIFLSLFIFLALVSYTYALWVLDPYPGFSFNNSNGQIIEIDTGAEQGVPTLQTGDIIKKIGAIPWEAYKKDARVLLFEGLQPGDIIEITVNRNGEDIVIPWKFMGFNQAVIAGRLVNIWFLSYAFWIVGVLTIIFVRPRDVLRNLFVLINYLTALWLISGMLSSSHLWGSSILLHALTWLLLPVYLHFHWIFPKPLTKLSSKFLIVFYLICSCFAIAEIFQLVHKSLYALAFLTALTGSFILQVIHFIKHKDQRREILYIIIALIVIFLPPIGLAILAANSSVPNFAPLGLIALPFMPLMYFYAIYRRSMGGLEIRLNRIISLYLFFIILGIAILVTIALFLKINIPPQNLLFIRIIIVLLFVFIAITTYPKFQKFIERYYLGITIDYEKLQESFSNLIVSNTTTESLLRMLEKDVFPSLLIRQYAFVQLENHHLHPLLMKGVTQFQIPPKEAISKLHEIAGSFIPNLPPSDHWIRLVLPLKVGHLTLGFFLLGSRDPDDIYHQQEILSMQSIANQTGVALSNILRAETLREMHERGIQRYEQERLRLSHELHDSVLQELSELRKNFGPISPKVEESYEIIKERLREVIIDLRPPALDNGLTYAIKTLAENLMQKSNDMLKVRVELQATEERLPEDIELHLFRIVEEFCNNTLRHAQAKLIRIEGAISPQHVDLSIADDGIGFEINEKWNLRTLLASRHFGLVGMFERTHLIGAKLDLQSQRNQGTKVQVLWSAKK